jgi:hypothetical protein
LDNIFLAVIGAPKLRCDEEVLSLDDALIDRLFDSLATLYFIFVGTGFI